MSIRTRILPVIPFLLGGFWLAPCASAGETSSVQCATNDDRVWVYDSLTNFTVELRLKCGEPVEVIGRTKGYVKIRTSGGKEGYVPDAAIPNLPPYEDPQTASIGGLASVVRTRKAGAVQPAVASAPSAEPASPVSAAAKPASPEVTAVMTVESVPVQAPASSASAAPTVAHVKAVSVTPKKAAKPAAKKPTPPQPPSVPATTTSMASSNSPAAGKTSAQKNADSGKTQAVFLSSSLANTGPRIESAVEKNSLAAGSNGGMKQSAVAGMRSVADTSDSEDDPDSKPEDQSADPACRVFFSAYGLAPAQYRWIAQNRQKKYPGICPASDPSQVDFVMIFTHDVEFYNSTLPDPVHVDRNGFSDFSPLTTIDSALISEAAADKAHRQYVWVFRMKRGAFDPAKFSPRRRPQFTKNESNSLTASHAADRSAEDAFQFVEEQGSTR